MATVIVVVRFSPSIFQGQSTVVELRMVGNTFSGYSTFRYPVFQKRLAEVQIELNYENVFEQQEMIERFNRGGADLMAMSLERFLREKPDGKIVGLIDRSIGADAAVLNTPRYPSLQSIEDLRPLVEKEGRRQLKIAYAKDSRSEFFLSLINKNDNALNSSLESLEVPDARDAWKRLQVDPEVALAILWEPYVTIARQQGYKVDFSTRNEPTRIVDVIVASNRLLQSQPKAVSQFLKVYYDRIISLVLDESLMQSQIFSDSELSFAAAAEVGKTIHFFTVFEANHWLTSGELEKQIESIANLLNLEPQNQQELFTALYIKDAVEEINSEFCTKLGNVPQFQEIKQIVCYPTPLD